MKKYYIISASLFLLSILMGCLFAWQDMESARSITSKAAATFDFVKELNPFLRMMFIFLNNSIKAFLMMVSGFFFGLVPLFFLFANGFIVGIVVVAIGDKLGLGLVVLSLLPHGIMEIPALIIASGLGLMLGVKFFWLLAKKEPFREFLKESLIKFFKIVLPLLAIAAAVETFISPYVTNKFLP